MVSTKKGKYTPTIVSNTLETAEVQHTCRMPNLSPFFCPPFFSI